MLTKLYNKNKYCGTSQVFIKSSLVIVIKQQRYAQHVTQPRTPARITLTCIKEGITYVHFINCKLHTFIPQQKSCPWKICWQDKICNEQFYKACYI